MKRFLVFALFAACLPTLVLSEDISPTGPQAGQELAAELRSSRPAENSTWSGSLVIYSPGKRAVTIPISGGTTVTETNWSATYSAAATAGTAAESLRIIFSTNAPPKYFYVRAGSPTNTLGELKMIANADADIPLAGSDFWLSDLGFEFFHWPDQIRKPGHVHRNRSCNQLECLNPHPAPGGYARVVLWLDKETGQPLDAEAYGADKKSLKNFELGSVKNVNGHYQVKELKMFNNKTGSRTELDFDLKNEK